MSIVLLILAGVVVYYLYITLQEYLKNPTTLKSPTKESKPSPYPLESTPYTDQSPAQKLQNSYEGASITLLAYVLQAGIRKQKPSQVPESKARNTHLTPLQTGLIKEFIHTLSEHTTKQDYKQNLHDLLAHYAPVFPAQSKGSSLDCSDLDQPSTASLAGIFLDNTYGEYKKRLQFVGLLLMLAWSDKDLNPDEQDIILDIAAFLEIENADFNALYESFEALPQEQATESTNTLEQLWSEQDTQDDKSLEQVFFTHIQKLCASARKKDLPQAKLLQTLWQSEHSFDTLRNQLAQNTQTAQEARETH